MPYKSHRKVRRIYQQQAKRLTSQEYMKWMGLYEEFFRLLERFFYQVVDRPTLVVMGSEDYVFYRSAKAFVRWQPQVELNAIRGTGHICNIEQPE